MLIKTGQDVYVCAEPSIRKTNISLQYEFLCQEPMAMTFCLTAVRVSASAEYGKLETLASVIVQMNKK